MKAFSEYLFGTYQSHRITVAIMFLVLLSFAEFRLLDLMHAPQFSSLVEAAEGVVTGYPHWMAYAARLLGPYMVPGISQLGIPYEKAL